ncbi:MAG: sulfatase-like hydrolase/transferase, partial [Bacteroidota bacterium]|nr:sulfatase-like hydrolase/transferase [Bacteroidota bacterium]
FFSTLFTLTSHHPYKVPDRYKDVFKEGRIEIHKSIRYSDYALKRFFETIKKMPWYNNTLFVLVADHTSLTDDPFYLNKVGNNTIPLLFFKPGSDLKGMNSTIAQQIDIMPSVLDYLDYPSPYFSFGNSVFDTTKTHFAFTMNNSYQLIEGDYSLTFNGTDATELYELKDSSLSKNVIAIEKQVKDRMERKAKAILQTYQQRLINNRMH